MIAALALVTCVRQTGAGELNTDAIHRAATDAHNLFLDASGRMQAVDTFLKLVSVRGPSGKEQDVADEVARQLAGSGAVRMKPSAPDEAAPKNLVMEIPATGALTNQPAILLNAHLDTIDRSTPEGLEFDGSKGDFYHRDDAVAGKVSSFGGDDRSAVAAIVAAVSALHTNYWSRGVDHRRIVLLFTAEEERGLVGAKYLSRHEPGVFKDVEISLSMDGPLDLRSKYPEDSFVAVVSESDREIDPYRKVLRLLADFCGRTRTKFAMTEYGLGMGDFAAFPDSAHAGLHLRSPVRGWHNHEHVNLQDQLNHVDLFCYLLLGWDQKLPTSSSPKEQRTK